MDVVHDPAALSQSSPRLCCQKWLPGLVASLGLLGLGEVAGSAELREWWFCGRLETQHLLIWNLKAAGIGVAVLTILPVTDATLNVLRARRVVAGSVYVSAGLKIGGGYIHLCQAGSRLVEGAALFGTPLVALLLVIFCRRMERGCIAATVVLTIVWLAMRPYLDWAHGN